MRSEPTLPTWHGYGDPDGLAMIYMHGTPGSGMEIAPADEIARELGLRIIAPDRPGYGDTPVSAQGNLRDWAEKIATLADGLQIDRFHVLGYSIGSIYAFACSHFLGDRVDGLTIVGGLADYDTPAMQAHLSPDFKPLYDLAATDIGAVTEQLKPLIESVDVAWSVLSAPMPEEDQAIFNNANILTPYLDSLEYALKQGPMGLVFDLKNTVQPWPFTLKDIHAQVELWHGNKDRNIGVEIGKYLAESLHTDNTHFLADQGHYFILSHWRQILENITTRMSSR